MTPAEAQMLLAIAASADNRKPSKEAATLWSHALGDLPFIDCRDAVVAHYTRTTDWLMPAHVITEVRKIRAKRLEEHPPLTPPADLDPIETLAWLKAARRRVADGELVVDETRELKPRHLPDLKALMPRVTP